VSGFRTLLYKEILRFWKVLVQTVGAPVLTALLYLLIFSHVLEDHDILLIDISGVALQERIEIIRTSRFYVIRRSVKKYGVADRIVFWSID